MKVIIMAGGKGTRIAELSGNVPKPMMKIDGKPILEHEIEGLRKQGFKDIIITVSHMSQAIMDYFGDGSKLSPATGKSFGVNIEYFYEEKPLGNAGALFKLREKLDTEFLLLNGDAIFDIDFMRMLEYHHNKAALVTLFTHPNSHPYDSGLLVADENGKVNKWLTKEEERTEFYKNRVNAGIHVISSQIFNLLSVEEKIIGSVDEYTGKVIKVDLDRQVLKPLVQQGGVFCYDSTEYVKDMGTPERFCMVEKDFKKGIVHARNLKNRQKAIFLDRDGTINKYVGFLKSIDEFELIDGVAEAIKKINESGYLCVVITNQPVIARGELTKEELERIHNKMETLLGNKGAYIDGLYYCPHHPHKGYEGEVKELKIECDCRKPKNGLFLKATAEFNIDLTESWMIGDSEMDVLAGKNAGCKTALISTERTQGMNFGQDMTGLDLLEIISMII